MSEFKGFVRGVNLGGWLSQCGYEKEHLETFITAKDIERIKSWGADHVRLPFDFNIILDSEGRVKPDGFLYLDRAVEWCMKQDMNIVLDLHKTVGFSFDKGERETGFFDNKGYQDIFVNLWIELAKHYASFEERVAFELLNEITDAEFAQPWNDIARRAVAEIRRFAPMNYILIGGIYNNSIYGLTLLDKPYDDRIVFNFHCYDPLIFTHQKAYWIDNMPSDYELAYPGPTEVYLADTERLLNEGLAGGLKSYTEPTVNIKFMEMEMKAAIEAAAKYDVPLYCGEYGVIDVAPDEDAVRWYEDMHSLFELYGIGRAMWTYKAKDFGIIDEKRKGIYNSLIELI
ncbi:MAG: glycoside hydrolase family 5 protein [Oscillospiraceae bacterium]